MYFSNIIFSTVEDIFRSLMCLLCRGVYRLIIYFYDIFIRLGSAEILTSGQVQKIYSRVTLILGIFMLFKLIFSFIQYLLNPEKLSDKSSGAGKLVMRTIIVIILLGTVPFIFQQAYKLQGLILESNIVGKVILATDDNSNTSSFGGELSSYLFMSFYRLNSDERCDAAGTELEDLRDEIIYNHTFNLSKECLNDEGDVNDYVIDFEMDGIISLAVGVLTLYIILSYCLSVAMRVVQLAFLQLIAVIPILSYLGEDKDGAFNKWVKRCISTFIDLFIRLAIIYFVVFIISLLMNTESSSYYIFMNSTGDPTGFTKILINVILILGLLLFAKKAPELLKEILPQGIGGQDYGFKNTNRLLGAVGSKIGGVAARGGLALIGNTGSAISRGRKALSNANSGYSFGRDVDGNRVYGKFDEDGNLIEKLDKNSDKYNAQMNARRRAILGSIFSGAGSVVSQTALGSVKGLGTPTKGNVLRNIGGASKRQIGSNNKLRYNIDQGSTFGGRMKEHVANITGFEMNGTAARYESDLSSYKDLQSTLKTNKSILDRVVSARKDIYNAAASDIETSTFSSDVCVAAQNRYREIKSISSVLSQTGSINGIDLKKSYGESLEFYHKAVADNNNEDIVKYRDIVNNLSTKATQSGAATMSANGNIVFKSGNDLSALEVKSDSTLITSLDELVSSRKDKSVKEIATYRMNARIDAAGNKPVDYDVTTSDAVNELEAIKTNYNDILSQYVDNPNVSLSTTDYGALNKYRKEVQSSSQNIKRDIDDYQIKIDNIEQSSEKGVANANRDAAHPVEGGLKGGLYRPHGGRGPGGHGPGGGPGPAGNP